MSPTAPRLLALLADGELHSGAQLATALSLTRAAVWKLVGELRELGIEIESLSRRGYRLSAAVELLDVTRLRGEASALGRTLPDALELHFLIGSTNDDLYAASPPPPGQVRAAFAELQQAGRGRRGRRWIAPFGTGLTFSVAWTFAETPAGLPALGLAMGVAIASELQRLGASGLALKWPNDLLLDGAKLGGVLTQLKQEAGGPATVVVGLGLNLLLPKNARRMIDQPGALPATDLASGMAGALPSRNAIAARLLLALQDALADFASGGFAGFAADWARMDALRDSPVQVLQGSARLEGTARGTDRDGALLVESAGRLVRVFSGDVSVRTGNSTLIIRRKSALS
jgi:BirA family transcriptional regulator, biotin operon repressor / biotin---[acetyl-CoA-carboxylase] ligase